MAFLSSIVKWGQHLIALADPPDGTGAISTVGAGPSGQFFWNSGVPAGFFSQLISNSNHYSTLTVQVYVPGTGGGTFAVNGSNDGTSGTYWTIPGVSLRAGSPVQNYATATALAFPTGPVSQSWSFAVAAIPFIKFSLLTAMTAGGTAQITWSLSNSPMSLPVYFPSILNSAATAVVEPATPVQPGNTTYGTNAALAVAPTAVIGTVQNNSSVLLRTPAIFRGSVFGGTSAGAQLVWTPQTGKKVRVMKYAIEAGEDCTITSGPLPVNLGFAFNPGVATANGQGTANCFGFADRFVLPGTLIATSFDGFVSGLVDLGNGVQSTAANQALYAGLNVPQSTSATDPTWTIASNQWEAITIGFKTTNSLGNFRLIQLVTQAAAGAATVTLPSVSTTPGSTVIIAVHTTNIAAGAPTITVNSNSAGDTYTPTTAQTNASDGANGSTLILLYTSNSIGNAANSIVLSFATHTPTEYTATYVEYAGPGMGSGGIDAAAVGTTGNTTAPASGNYTPNTAGDLIFAAFGTSASLAAIPVMATAGYFARGASFNATQGALGVADNFGNGALLAGAINIIAIGTEE